MHTVDALGARIGMPTCWDEWFPKWRGWSLAGAEIIVYPIAIGRTRAPRFRDTAAVAAGDRRQRNRQRHVHDRSNRHGDEGAITFYGSSFISDPYGRILVQAPRDESAVLVADLDLDQRRDWLTLFPFLATRRPDTYGRSPNRSTRHIRWEGATDDDVADAAESEPHERTWMAFPAHGYRSATPRPNTNRHARPGRPSPTPSSE